MGKRRISEQENFLRVGFSILSAEARGVPGIIATVIIILIVAWLIAAGLLQ